MDNYEIKIKKSWHTVDEQVFRSWQGERKLNGNPYSGPVFYYLSNEQVRQVSKNSCIPRPV